MSHFQYFFNRDSILIDINVFVTTFIAFPCDQQLRNAAKQKRKESPYDALRQKTIQYLDQVFRYWTIPTPFPPSPPNSPPPPPPPSYHSPPPPPPNLLNTFSWSSRFRHVRKCLQSQPKIMRRSRRMFVNRFTTLFLCLILKQNYKGCMQTWPLERSHLDFVWDWKSCGFSQVRLCQWTLRELMVVFCYA